MTFKTHLQIPLNHLLSEGCRLCRRPLGKYSQESGSIHAFSGWLPGAWLAGWLAGCVVGWPARKPGHQSQAAQPYQEITNHLWLLEIYYRSNEAGGWRASWLADWLAGWLAGWLASSLVGLLAGCLEPGWLAGWLAGWLVSTQARPPVSGQHSPIRR